MISVLDLDWLDLRHDRQIRASEVADLEKELAVSYLRTDPTFYQRRRKALREKLSIESFPCRILIILDDEERAVWAAEKNVGRWPDDLCEAIEAFEAYRDELRREFAAADGEKDWFGA